MRILNVLTWSLGFLLVGCSPVKDIANNEYQLTAFNDKQVAKKPNHVTLWVTAPDAAAGYQTEQMLYVKKPFQLQEFAKNVWSNPPADMLYPLLVQSLQRSGYFHAVVSSPYNVESDYRLDTQILNLEQNFLRRPSVIDLSAKVVLTRNSDNKVMASRIISLHIPCPQDNPYGGVIAANQATYQLTGLVSQFVIAHLKP